MRSSVFALAAQADKRLAFEIQQMLLAHRRRVRQGAAGENAGQLSSDERVVVADAPGAPRQVHAEA